MATKQPDPQPHPDPAPEGAAGPDGAEDDVKRRFREALERKNGKHATSSSGGGEHAKVHGGAHGPAHTQRTFRRKSGG